MYNVQIKFIKVNGIETKKLFVYVIFYSEVYVVFKLSKWTKVVSLDVYSLM